MPISFASAAKKKMSLKSAFRLSLNKISILSLENSTPTEIKIKGHNLLFDLVKLEETNYLNFILLKDQDVDPALLEPIEKFLKLITVPEYISLTFNTFFIDELNQKVLFVPSILPNYSYEFDFVDEPQLITKLNEELTETCVDLGFLTLKGLKLDPIDYVCSTGKLKAALQCLD